MVILHDATQTHTNSSTTEILSVMGKADRVLPFDSKLKYLYRELQLNKQYKDSNQGK